ncbi:MAG: hypothetical protein NC409_11610 [Clostridium sp.]|nr:hypothetical protein [Clostridium sp.]
MEYLTVLEERMILFIIVPLSAIIEMFIYFFLIMAATQIDGGAAVASAVSKNVQGIFIVFFVLNLLIVSVITFWAYHMNKGRKRGIAVVNVLSVAYKALIIGIYGFIWGTFMCVPALAGSGMMGIIGQLFNFLGSLIIPGLHLIIQLVIWLPFIFIEEIVSKKKDHYIYNIMIRVLCCAICTYLVKVWLFGHSIPYLLDVSEPQLIENIYGSDIFVTLQKMGLIKS